MSAGLAAAPPLVCRSPYECVSGRAWTWSTWTSRPARIGRAIASVETPDVPQLPWRMDGRSVKEFPLIAEPVKQEIDAQQDRKLVGLQRHAPGRTVQVNQGDRVRTFIVNQPSSLSQLPFTSMDLKSQSRWMERREVVKTRFRPAAGRLRVHVTSGGDVLLLPLPHGDARNDGNDRDVHHASQRRHRSRAPTKTSRSLCRSTPSCRTSMSRTP